MIPNTTKVHGLAPLALALLVLTLGAGTARGGPPDDPIGDGKHGRIRLGWERRFPPAGLVPVTVLLENPDSRPHVFRVSVGVGTAQAEETVALPANGRRRVEFALPPERLAVSVSIARDGKLVATEERSGATFPAPAVLLVDGEPASRTTTETVAGASTLACAPEDLSPELACYLGFQAIVLRHANPARAGEGARGVLVDFVRAGGTVVVCPETGRGETRALWEETEGPPVSRGPFEEKRRGLGRVLLAPGDPCASTVEAAAIRAGLAQELDLVPRRLFPRVFAGETENEAAHRAGKLLALFFGLYFLVAGPILARRLRGAPPARVLRAVLVLVVLFSGLAAVVATTLRRQLSRVDAFTFVLVPEEGEPLAMTEVVVASGGATRESLVLEGEDVSATAAQRGAPVYPYDFRYSNAPLWTPTGARTLRGVGVHAVTFESLSVPPLGDVRVHALARARSYRRLDARVEVDPTTGALVARVHNTSGRALGPTVVYEAVHDGPLSFARFPDGLAAGATAVAPVTSRGRHGSAPQLVGYPATTLPVGWEALAPREPDGSDPRWVLMAEDEPPLAVRAGSGAARHRAWRVEAALAPVSSASLPGFIGLKVAPSGTGVQVTGASPRAAKRPADWLPSVGTTIVAVGGAPVRSQEDLDRAFARVPADSLVEVTTTDQRFWLRLPAPSSSPPSPRAGPVPPLPPEEGEQEGE